MVLKRLTVPKPMFLGRTNLGEQLDAESKTGLTLEYKPSERMVYVTFNGETAIVPVEGCYLIPMPEATAIKSQPKIQIAKTLTAQVSTPQGDLMTPGKGRTGQEK